MKDDKPKNGSPGAKQAPWHTGRSKNEIIDVADQLQVALQKTQAQLVKERGRADRFANLSAALILGSSLEEAEKLVPYADIERIRTRYLEIEAERTSENVVMVKVAIRAQIEEGKTDASQS
jgi:hypothetical protein